jgi:metal-responsive CopG/Arc/MetJ family transcriptional regulator
MGKASRATTKHARKPRPPAPGEQVVVRLQPDLLTKIDKWRRNQYDLPSRAEAMRRLVDQALESKKKR